MIKGSFMWAKEVPNRNFIPKHRAHAKSPVNIRGGSPGDEKHKHLIEPVRPVVQIYGQTLTGNI